MIVHTNIEKYTILYTIMHGLQICTINKRLVNELSVMHKQYEEVDQDYK